VNYLVEPKKGTNWPKNLHRFQDRQEAIAVCKKLCKIQFILRSEKLGKGELEMSRVRDFDESGYFTWIYEGNKTFSHLMTSILIGGFFFCTCFPIWPTFLKVFVWYLSVSFLLFIFFLVSVRGFMFLCFWIIGFEFWFLPNIFDEQLGFYDSFKPVYSFEKTKSGQLIYRLGVGGAFFAFCYWAVTQPSEFDGYKSAQIDFIKDLYAGKLLPEKSQFDKENIDKPKYQSLEDILASSDDEEEVVKLTEEEEVDSILDNLLDEEEDIDEELD